MSYLPARLFCLALVLAAGVGACVPTAARKNARLQHGFDVDLIAGVQLVEQGEASDGSSTAELVTGHFELDLQYAHKSEDGSGFAFQGKFPASIVFTSFDFYYQLPENSSRWFYGFGAELGALPGVYGVVTHFLNDDFYLSFTPRVLNARSRGEQAVLINPSLALGMSGEIDVSLFASFSHHTGRGFDFDIDLFGPNDRNDYRKNYWLAGGSLRF